MAKPKLAWWVIPSVITGSVAALGAVGTLIIGSAKWLTLPEKVEAGEVKNVEQDKALDKLTAIQETWQNIYQQQQQVSNPVIKREREPPPLLTWEDADGTLWCCDPRTDCEDVGNWWECG